MTWSHGTKSTMLDGKWRSGTSKNNEILYHVTKSCKGPIITFNQHLDFVCCQRPFDVVGILGYLSDGRRGGDETKF